MGREAGKAGSQAGKYGSQPDPHPCGQGEKVAAERKIGKNRQTGQEACHGSEKIAAEGQADAQGVQRRAIVGPGIFVKIDRGDWDLRHGNMVALTIEEHVGLVFVPAPENAGKRRQAGRRNGPQPGLGIPDWNSAQTIQKKGHHPIAAFSWPAPESRESPCRPVSETLDAGAAHRRIGARPVRCAGRRLRGEKAASAAVIQRLTGRSRMEAGLLQGWPQACEIRMDMIP